MPSPCSISIIVPVYNEAGLLIKAIEDLRRFLDAHFNDWEIILIESGSTDASAKVCDELATSSPRLRCLHETQRNGFGSALRLGFKHATKDLVLMTTADQPFPLEAIDAALPHLANCDCVLSYRSVDPRKSVFRKVQSAAYNLIARCFLGIKARHVNSAFKLYKRTMIQSLELVSRGWFIDAEIVYWITHKRISHVVIPVAVIDRAHGRSTVTFSTAWSVILELAHFLRSRRRNR